MSQVSRTVQSFPLHHMLDQASAWWIHGLQTPDRSRNLCWSKLNQIWTCVTTTIKRRLTDAILFVFVMPCPVLRPQNKNIRLKKILRKRFDQMNPQIKFSVKKTRIYVQRSAEDKFCQVMCHEQSSMVVFLSWCGITSRGMELGLW